MPGVVRRIIEAQPEVNFDRAHFTGFGESSLDYVVVYIMQTANYGTYMDTQQTVNIAMMREFAAMGVEFAFPTRTVLLEKLPEPLQSSAQANGAGPAALGVAH